MKYIIMCGGNYDKILKEFKPLIKINGEPLVERTIRLLRKLGIEDIAVSTNTEIDLLDYLDVPIIKFDSSYVVYGDYDAFEGYWCDAFYKTDEPVCYLFGDVFFSEKALKTIVDAQTDEVLFFGTDRPFAPGYPKRYEEPLAFKVANQKILHKGCDETKRLQDLGRANWPFVRQPVSWELAQVISKQPLNRIIVHTPIFVGIHDFASDIDHDYEAPELERLVKEYNIQ